MSKRITVRDLILSTYSAYVEVMIPVFLVAIKDYFGSSEVIRSKPYKYNTSTRIMAWDLILSI